jgi:hypothetical protein
MILEDVPSAKEAYALHLVAANGKHQAYLGWRKERHGISNRLSAATT